MKNIPNKEGLIKKKILKNELLNIKKEKIKKIDNHFDIKYIISNIKIEKYGPSIITKIKTINNEN